MVAMVDFRHPDITFVNAFDFMRVRWAVAHYVAYPERRRGDWLEECFYDFRGKCEFEYLLMGLSGQGEPKKVDIWTMYIEPNRDILYEIVHSISRNSALQYLRAEKAKRKGNRLRQL